MAGPFEAAWLAATVVAHFLGGSDESAAGATAAGCVAADHQ